MPVMWARAARPRIIDKSRIGTARARMAPMRIRRGAIFVTLALAAACSSEEQLSPQPLPPEDQENPRSPTPPPGGASDGNSLGTCSGTCCTKPAEGTACNSREDSLCSWAVTCPTGLVLPYEVTCTNGVWAVTNGCPEEGQTDTRGCPARQPENGTACSSATGFLQCGYVLECQGYRKSAQAVCANTTNGSTWTTTPLGACD
jgi:hypothetical protein